MDVLLSRYRNLTVLVVAVVVQLGLLAYQVRDDHDIRLLRVWAVSAVTPAARVLEFVHSGASNFFNNYFFLVNTRQENLRLKAERDALLLENQQMRVELSTADRAKELGIFRQTSLQVTLAARVIGNTTGGNIAGAGSRAVMVDRGSGDGVAKGMAVITPTGIVGKVIQVFPNASFVMLVTDPAFGAGVISQKNHVRGLLRGQGKRSVVIQGIQNEQPLEQDELFFTSGDDLIFPRGLPVGRVTMLRAGKGDKEVTLSPHATELGLDEVLIVTRGVHELIPNAPEAVQPVVLQAPPDAQPSGTTSEAPGEQNPPALANTPLSGRSGVPPRGNDARGTDADRVMQGLRTKAGVPVALPASSAPAVQPPRP